MPNRSLKIPALLGLALFAFAGRAASASASGFRDDSPPPIPREFRAVWVATVNNIDWPSKPGLPTSQQQAELIAILDRAAALHLNAVVFQVRSGCDALYDSKIEPWSEYLTGKMGQPPSPFYDPLSFAIAEAHKRGLELHAWFNPYRARSQDAKSPVSPGHVSIRHPELVRSYGKYLWLDPGEQATRDYSLSVIMDVVRRYDVDGIHFDDYFYPYPEKSEKPNGQELDFPDTAAWQHYQGRGGKLSRNDWRRENVNQFIETVYRAVKKEKPWVKCGISPFGIWRPGNPPQITGFDSYDKLYCDARKWLHEGWLDYLAPQLYWPIGQKPQSFPVLLQWWNAQNSRRRNLWPGIRVSGWPHVNDDASELAHEIDLTRKLDAPPGVVLWHSKPLMRNEAGVADALENKIYRSPALVPAFPWLSQSAPESPRLNIRRERGELQLAWAASDNSAFHWVVQKKIDGRWTLEILPKEKTSERVAAASFQSIAVTAVNRYGNVSLPAIYYAGNSAR
jgi:uncharacterized lipoprotein YddW (UPF0748 family)